MEVWLQRAAGAWGGLQAFVSVDGATFVDLGAGFGASHLNLVHDGSPGWVDGNAPENAYRDLGGVVDLLALGLAPVPPGGDLHLRFDAHRGPVPTGAKKKDERDTAAFLDALRVSVQPWEEAQAQGEGPAVVPTLPPAALLPLVVGLGAIARRPLTR